MLNKEFKGIIETIDIDEETKKNTYKKIISREKGYNFMNKTIKYGLTVAVVLAFVVVGTIFGGNILSDSKNNKKDIIEDTNNNNNTGVVNPYKSIKNSDEFKTLGFTIKEPSNSTDVSYYIINGETADVRFTNKEINYTYRASKINKDLSGIFEDIKDTNDIVINDVNVKIKKTVNNSTIAEWTKNGINFELSTTDDVSEMNLNNILNELTK